MGCCFSKEQNPNLVSERTSLLQTPVAESCSVKDVKQCACSVAELVEEKLSEYGETNMALDTRSNTATPVNPSLIDERSNSVQDGTVLWNEPCGDATICQVLEQNGVSKEASREPRADGEEAVPAPPQITDIAMLNSVKKNIVENAVKRANWFREATLPHCSDFTGERWKSHFEDVDSAVAIVPNSHCIGAACTSSSQGSEENAQVQSTIKKKSEVRMLGAATCLHDKENLYKSDEWLTSEHRFKTRTQSFYSICSIDADDLDGECELLSIIQPAAFNQMNALHDAEAELFNNFSLLHNATNETEAFEILHTTRFPVRSSSVNKGSALPDLLGTFHDVVSEDENAISEKDSSVPLKDRTKQSVVGICEKSGHQSSEISPAIASDETTDETIPDLLENEQSYSPNSSKNTKGPEGQHSEHLVNHTDLAFVSKTSVNTDTEQTHAAKLKVSGVVCGVYPLEAPNQESVASEIESANKLEADKNYLKYADFSESVDVNFESQAEIDLNAMDNACHEAESQSSLKVTVLKSSQHLSSSTHCEKFHKVMVHDLVSFSSSDTLESFQDTPSSFISALLQNENAIAFQKCTTGVDFQKANKLNVDSEACLAVKAGNLLKSCGSSSSDFEEKLSTIDVGHTSGEFHTFRNLQLVRGGNTDLLPTDISFQKAAVACPENVVPCTEEKSEINYGIQDIVCTISSTNLSKVSESDPVNGSDHVEMIENTAIHKPFLPPSVTKINSHGDDAVDPTPSSLKDFTDVPYTSTKSVQTEQPLPGCALVTAVVSTPTVNNDGNTGILGHLAVCDEQQKETILPISTQEFIHTKGEEKRDLKENEYIPVVSQCFSRDEQKGLGQISLSRVCVETDSEVELQQTIDVEGPHHYFNLADDSIVNGLDITVCSGDKKELANINIQCSLPTALPSQIESSETSDSATLSKNSMVSESACIPSSLLLGQVANVMQSTSDGSNQESESNPVGPKGMCMIGTEEEGAVVDYSIPLVNNIRPLFEIGEPSYALQVHDCTSAFALSRLQGYQLESCGHASCGLQDSEMCLSTFSAVANSEDETKCLNKAIPLPIEPDQVDIHASTPSYEIHFRSVGKATVPEQIDIINRTYTHDSEGDQSVLNMVSDFLGKSDMNKDGNSMLYLSTWSGEPEALFIDKRIQGYALESAWLTCHSEEEIKEGCAQQDNETDLSVILEDHQAFPTTYPYSLLNSNGSFVWNWQNPYSELVSVLLWCV